MTQEAGNEGKYGKLREGATRSERKEATLDDMRKAAADVRKAADKLGKVSDADREQRASIARDAASLAESARLIAGVDGDPAGHYRKQMREGARQAASDVDFQGVLEASVADLTRTSGEAAEAAREACLQIRETWDEGVVRRRVDAMGRVFTAGCVVLAACCVALTAVCFVKMAPVFTGVAVVSYEPGYESELDRTRLELEFARNELDAYRRQYPLGIGDTAQADLDAANRAAQEAYDADHAG